MRFDTSFFLNTLLKACGGIPITLLMTFGALAIAFPIGLLVSISRVNKVPVLSQIGAFYVSIIRGTPVIIQIFLIYSIAPNALHDFAKAHNLAIDVYGINPVWYAIFVFGFNTATHFSEIFRSALLAVPKGQKEAAYSLGFSRVQTYVKFILPQAFVVASPSICTASLNMLKNTSLAFMMAVMTLLRCSPRISLTTCRLLMRAMISVASASVRRRRSIFDLGLGMLLTAIASSHTFFHVMREKGSLRAHTPSTFMLPEYSCQLLHW